MFEKIANIFKIPDLRKRVLFTLGMLAVYRLGSHIPTPGINADMLAQFFNQNSGSRSRPRRSLLGRKPPQAHRLRPRHHAVYYGVDHLPAAHGHL